MNPSSNETQLPPPVMEQVPAGANQAELESQAAEQVPVAPEKTTASFTVPPIALPLLPIAPATDNAAQDNTASVTVTNPLQVTDDGDLIEKEWVNKAKQIVEQTRDDPYKQTEELTVFKADYMQKRYGKTIKLNQ